MIVFNEHTNFVLCLAILPRRPSLLVSSSKDQTIRVWNMDSAKSVQVRVCVSVCMCVCACFSCVYVFVFFVWLCCCSSSNWPMHATHTRTSCTHTYHAHIPHTHTHTYTQTDPSKWWRYFSINTQCLTRRKSVGCRVLWQLHHHLFHRELWNSAQNSHSERWHFVYTVCY